MFIRKRKRPQKNIKRMRTISMLRIMKMLLLKIKRSRDRNPINSTIIKRKPRKYIDPRAKLSLKPKMKRKKETYLIRMRTIKMKARLPITSPISRLRNNTGGRIRIRMKKERLQIVLLTRIKIVIAISKDTNKAVARIIRDNIHRGERGSTGNRVRVMKKGT